METDAAVPRDEYGKTVANERPVLVPRMFSNRAFFEYWLRGKADGPVVNLNGVTELGGTMPALEYETRVDGTIHLKGGI